MSGLQDIPDDQLMGMINQKQGVAALSDDDLMKAIGQTKPAPAPVSIGKTAYDQWNQGVTFGLGDELSDRVAAGYAALNDPENLGFSKSYDKYFTQARESTKNDLEQEMAQHPYVSVGANLAGQLATGKLIGDTQAAKAVGRVLGSGADYAGQAAGKLWGPLSGVARFGAKTAEASGLGAASGALYGAGAADDGQAAEGAGHGAVMGGVLGAAAPTLAAVLGEVKNTAGDLLSSKNKVIGQTLNKLASDPDTALQALQSYKSAVPNSPATVAEATGDLGLSALQRALRNTTDEFGDVISQKNAAQTAALDAVAGTPKDIEIAEEAREAATRPLREAAFANKTEVMPSEVNDKINEIMSSPTGQRDAVDTAMNWVKGKLKNLTPINETSQTQKIGPFGEPLVEQNVTLKGHDPEELYEVRKDIAEAIAGKFDAEKPGLRLAAKQLMQVRDALDQTIERGAPGYADYMKEYAARSKPIEQMRSLQELKTGTLSTQYDPATGQYYISQPKFSNYMRSNAPDLAKVLTQQQMDTLAGVGEDLNRGSYANNPAIKPTGSDTMMNAMKNGKVSALSSALMQHIPGVKGFAEARQDAIREGLAKALANPQDAAQLMGKYGVKTPGQYNNALVAILAGGKVK